MTTTALLAAAAIAGLSGCGIDTVSGPVRHESRTIDRDTSDTARVDLRMGAGDLHVDGGAAGLMQADFDYNIPAWKPEVRYRSFAGRADLTIEQPGGPGHIGGQSKYAWDLRLNNGIPIDLLVHFGAGQGRLNLGALDLRSVEVEMGVGQIAMDLRGMPKRDYDVRIHGGIGEATVYLPSGAGVYAKAEGGLGEIKVSGLRPEGRHWINDWYASTRPQVRVDVQGGIGQINLIAE